MKITFMMPIIILLVILGMLFFNGKITNAQGDNAELLVKLDKVLENQASIMQSLDYLKTELNVVKIRVTQQQ